MPLANKSHISSSEILSPSCIDFEGIPISKHNRRPNSSNPTHLFGALDLAAARRTTLLTHRHDGAKVEAARCQVFESGNLYVQQYTNQLLLIKDSSAGRRGEWQDQSF